MEANPESLTKGMVKDIFALGVNRLSIGVQSFDDEILKMLGRAHDTNKAREAIKLAKERFENVSVDIICGIPGQTTKQLEDSLNEVVILDVSHVSIYPLTIEEHTQFHKWLLAEKIDDIDEDTQAQHMKIASQILGDAGFLRYEIASYAKPGFESKHNVGYWTGVPYIGFGRSAVTMTQNDERRMRYQFDEVIDDLDKKQKCVEDLMLGMRMCKGVSLDKVEEAEKLGIQAHRCFSELVSDGFVQKKDSAYVPTEKGWLLGNEMFERIFDL
ncbi:MAG: radical SAM protein [Enterococcus sp.]|nr:radical SAM protein [Enterococcus sp.]